MADGRLQRASSQGFTLLEIMLVVAIAAGAALAASSLLPASHSPRMAAKPLAAALNYAADSAVNHQRIIGVALRRGEYRLFSLQPTPDGPRWHRLLSGRGLRQGSFPSGLRITLDGRPLPEVWPAAPQLIFLPDGEVSPFNLRLEEGRDKAAVTLSSTGFLPLASQQERQ